LLVQPAGTAFAGVRFGTDDVASFAEPIDAVSAHIEEGIDDAAVSGWNGTSWLPWETLEVEDDEMPGVNESNLVMFPTSVTAVRYRGISESDLHPIRVSNAPVKYDVAATSFFARPHILSRSDWGADESLTIKSTKPGSSSSSVAPQSDDNGGGSGQPSQREADCKQAYTDYPDEFKTSSTVTETPDGQKLLWPQQYSKKVQLLVVHHTALAVTGETRSGPERMRALYQYHAASKGWGDIGYHYVIDETGQIYEGRKGGDSVVAGHAYCNNVNTVGIALMGNFMIERPTQEQIHSLQWLLRVLSDKYDIAPGATTKFHGKTMQTIVGHRDVLSTECPGTQVWSVLDQIREHVRLNDPSEDVTFPIPLVASSSSRSSFSSSSLEPGAIPTNDDGLASLSQTTVEGRPGGEIVIPVYFRAARKNYTKNTRIARLTHSAGMQVWQEREGKYAVARDIRLSVPLLKPGESTILRVKVRLPMSRGNSTLTIGSLKYAFTAEGRSVRGQQVLSTSVGGVLPENPAPTNRASSSVRSAPSISSSSSTSSSSPSGKTIRILLTGAGETPRLTAGDPLMINGRRISTAGMSFSRNGSQCQAEDKTISSLIRITADGPIAVNGRQYRGTIECRVQDGKLILINELSLEEYMAGLGEEPDTEPYQKQRAFAIAARTYAQYYLDSANRKFPGAPYDGSDSPATFQKYSGYDFETQNSEWVRAVRSTAEQLIRYQGNVIKPPYFSSDDGRTRSPAEAGWTTFPFIQIFASKSDPWCTGMSLAGHGVGMSGCGAEGQANEGKTGEQILQYYYPGTTIGK
jgi:hypothetical protein